MENKDKVLSLINYAHLGLFDDKEKETLIDELASLSKDEIRWLFATALQSISQNIKWDKLCEKINETRIKLEDILG